MFCGLAWRSGICRGILLRRTRLESRRFCSLFCIVLRCLARVLWRLLPAKAMLFLFSAAIADKGSLLSPPNQAPPSFYGSNTFCLSQTRWLMSPRFHWRTLLRLFCTFHQRLFRLGIGFCPRLGTVSWIVPTHFSLPKQVWLSSLAFEPNFQSRPF